MLTRCPQCETLYRLSSEQLDAANGKVRCSRCNKVFNALEHMQNNESNQPVSVEAETEIEEPIESTPQPTPEPPKNETKPITKKIGISKSPLFTDDEDFDETSANPYFQPTQKTHPIWFGLIALLCIGISIQLVWLDRHNQIHGTTGKALLSTICNVFGCTLPQPRDIKNLRILNREMSSHPKQKDALLFELVMANKASFDQPLPYLQLKLFDNNRRPAGQRVFEPKEYLGQNRVPKLLKAGQTMHIRLDLLDPGPNISGFEINFL